MKGAQSVDLRGHGRMTENNRKIASRRRRGVQIIGAGECSMNIRNEVVLLALRVLSRE